MRKRKKLARQERERSREQFDRMLAGELYQVEGPMFSENFAHAMLYQQLFNETHDTDTENQRKALENLLGEMGDGIMIRRPFRVDYGRHISIGDGTFVNYDCIFLDVAPITIGKNCQIAPRVQLSTAWHPLEPTPRAAGWEGGSPITIGDNVWLGAGVIVIGGVTIGDNTVVGAGSVVTRDLPANVIAVGNPAKILRELPPDVAVEDVAPGHLL